MLKNIIKLFNKFKDIKNIDLYLLFATTLLIYIHNLSPAVYGGDSGDFIVAAVTKGIAHPSGYPLEVILGILSLLLPFNQSPAWKMGLTSALAASLGVILMYSITRLLTNKRWLAVISALTLAFIYPYWLYAEVVEVFALHCFLILLTVFLTLKYSKTKREKYIYLLAFTVGLSLTNNLTILLIYPGVAVFLLLTNWKIILNFKLILKSIFIFLLGLSVYLYIPIAASFSPALNWGRVVNLNNFIALITRQDYGWAIGSGYKTDVLLNNIKMYFLYLKSYITLTPLIFSVLGIIYLIINKKYKVLLFFSLIFFFFGPFYLIVSKVELGNYGLIGILERFYLSSVISLLLFFPYGALLSADIIHKSLKNRGLIVLIEKILIIVLAIIPISLLTLNYKKTDLSRIYIGDNLGKDLLSSLPQNSVLLLTDDSMAFSSLYAQNALEIREDVFIPGNYGGLDKVTRDFFYNENFKSKSDINEFFIKRRNRIDKNLLFSSIAPLLNKNVNIFTDSTFSVIDDKYGRIETVPYCLTYKLMFAVDKDNINEKEYLDTIEGILNTYHLEDLRANEDLLSENILFEHIRRLYVRCYIDISKYVLDTYHDKEKSVEYFRKAKELDPLMNL